MSMNLRADDTFVEDKGWHEASSRRIDFLLRHNRGHILYLELGVDTTRRESSNIHFSA